MDWWKPSFKVFGRMGGWTNENLVLGSWAGVSRWTGGNPV